MHVLDVGVQAAGFGGLGWGLWRIYRQGKWSHDVQTEWMNDISQRIGDDRNHPPVPLPPDTPTPPAQ